MASRKEQKEAARARRLDQERELALKARRNRRLQMLGGAVAAVIVVVVIVVIVAGGGGSKGKAVDPTSPQATATANKVATLLKGIPQNGTTLGNPKAPVTMTEYGDLVCPVCQQFALGAEQQLISNDVRKGKVKIVYKALETASQTANDSMFVPGQMAARAAGEQKLGWNYIELFYHEQQDETKTYVTPAFLSGLAQQIKGLSLAKWNADKGASSLRSQVLADESAAQTAGYQSTPTMIFQGPVSAAKPIVGDTNYQTLEQALKSVST